ncbi:MAG: hypothetical protein DI604_06575 [Delftia acidovorans]|nr:MAG: hypothetical protein DI604_06575 [Delftia acidovorans]
MPSRSHCSGTRQPHRRADNARGPVELHERLGTQLGTRGRAFACQARMQPCSAAVRDNKSPLSPRRVPASATCKAVSMPSHGHASIDLQAPFVIHYRLPRAILGPLLRGAKGVAVVTCPSSPGPEPGWPSPRGDRPEVLFRGACAFDPRQPCGWALMEARQGYRSPDPAPDAGSRSRHHPSTRVSRRQRLCLPSWAPRWSPLKRSTPPWTFGQGWTHARGWRCEFQD